MPNFSLDELIQDAERSPRLTLWEREFLDNTRARLHEVMGNQELLTFSEKQEEVLAKIEAKVYAAG